MSHPRWFKVRKTTYSKIIGKEPEVKIMFIKEANLGMMDETGYFEGPPSAERVEYQVISLHDYPEVAYGDED